MSRIAMDRLKEMLCAELEDIANKNDLSHGDLETVHKLTDTIKNIDKIEYLDDGEYSMDGGWRAEGMYSRNDYNGNSYGNGYGNSYARNGIHYVRGHYSRDDGKGMLMEHIEGMMHDNRLSADEKNTLKKAMDILRK